MFNTFGDRYTGEDYTQVTVFTDNTGWFRDYQPRQSLAGCRGGRSTKVSLVVTARNEIDTLPRLFSSILAQTRQPDEIIAVDTGSTDGTYEALQTLAGEYPLALKIVYVPGANIARGRNSGIRQASYEVIAVTDFGVSLPHNWLEDLVAPFESDARIQVSAGRYQAVDAKGSPRRWLLGTALENINPQAHLPSGVSAAFRKTAWEAVGGYPEWLTLTGEDTYFALELKGATQQWAFVPEAVVYWEAPATLAASLRKAYFWSIGDGEAGTTARAYRWAAYKVGLFLGGMAFSCLFLVLAFLWNFTAGLVAFVLLALLGGGFLANRLRRKSGSLKQELLILGTYMFEVAGFVEGMRHRPLVDRKRAASLEGVFFILAGVPIDDTGGGARWTQIAREMIRRHYLVVYLYKFPKYETVELNLHIRHPNLIVHQLKEFRWADFWLTYGWMLRDRPLYGLIELPLPEFLPIIENIHANQGVLVYDLLDNWESALGGMWYSKEIEEKIIAKSQVLTSTAPKLAVKLENRALRKVHLLPNAVNSDLFNPDRNYHRPLDLPPAEWVVMYVGALWGEWFDWALLKTIARQNRETVVAVIGDYAGQCLEAPPNLHFLGLKAQKDLPAYLAHAHVAIVPWKINAITQATSPLKVYEYLAMRLPVVAPAIDPLRNLPGVYLAENTEGFLQQIQTARLYSGSRQSVDVFVRQNNWKARVDALLELLNGKIDRTS